MSASGQLYFFYDFWRSVFSKEINLSTSGDTFYIQLIADASGAPSLSADAIETDLPADLSTGGGYTSGGVSIGQSTAFAVTAGTLEVQFADKSWTVTGSALTFRHIVILDNTHANKQLFCTVDFGSDQTVAVGDVFKFHLTTNIVMSQTQLV